MSVTKSYSRPKSAQTNNTGMVLTILTAEKPNAPAAVTAGTTGELDCRIQCDADESAGADVQDLFKIEAAPQISAEGVVSIAVTVTPIKGDGTLGISKSLNVNHDENMDVWQTAAGRPRQA